MDWNGTKCPPPLRGPPRRAAGTCGPCAAAGGSRYVLFPWVLPPAGAKAAVTPIFSKRTSGLVGRQRSCREHSALIGLDQLHIEAQRLQLTNQNIEGLRHTRLNGRFAFDDGLVNLGAAIDVIGLRGEQFLKDVGCAVGFQGPHFHFAEALTAELRLAAQWLLG